MLEQALTHRSFTEGDLQASNERLEFLGDAVLGFIITEYLYKQYPEWDQGQLSKAKATIVCESTLAEAARRVGLQKDLRLSPGEEMAGGRERPSILADAFEAVVAALFLDGGLEQASRFVLRHLRPDLQRLARGTLPLQDYKSHLQEFTQAEWRLTPTYHVIEEHGSPHEKTFLVEVRLASQALGVGRGTSKKQAEQNAAAQALRNLQEKRRTPPDEKG